MDSLLAQKKWGDDVAIISPFFRLLVFSTSAHQAFSTLIAFRHTGHPLTDDGLVLKYNFSRVTYFYRGA
jgi:hypothetical protein